MFIRDISKAAKYTVIYENILRGTKADKIVLKSITQGKENKIESIN